MLMTMYGKPTGRENIRWRQTVRRQLCRLSRRRRAGGSREGSAAAGLARTSLTAMTARSWWRRINRATDGHHASLAQPARRCDDQEA